MRKFKKLVQQSLENIQQKGYEFSEIKMTAKEWRIFWDFASRLKFNQSELTDERIDAWVEQIQKEF